MRPTRFIGRRHVRRSFLLATSAAVIGLTPSLYGDVVLTGDTDPTDPASITPATNIFAGQLANGSVSIDDGTTLSVQGLWLGMSPGVTGTATIDTAAKLTLTTFGLIAGDDGNGQATLSNNATLRTVGVTVASQSTSSSWFNLSGADTAMVNTGTLIVGQGGTGRMTLSGGASAISTGIIMGRDAGGSGHVTVQGVGTQFNAFSGQTMNIGFNGSGSMLVEQGGSAAATTVQIGGAGTSAATVTGAGSLLQGTVNLFVSGSNASLVLTNGGAASSNTAIVGGVSAGSADINGGSWTNSGEFTIGENSTGRVQVRNGGQINSAWTYIGSGAGTGIVTVSGGSTLSTTNSLILGNLLGNGTLSLQAGSKVTAGQIGIGSGTSSVGFATVNGTQATLQSTGLLTVGNFGTGTLEVIGGTTVTSGGGVIGNGGPGSGTIGVSGSRWTNSGSLVVGNNGVGLLNILAGAAVTNTDTTLAAGSLASGTVIVSQAGTSWTTGQLVVGNNGSGRLTVSSSGSVTSGAAVISAGSGTGRVHVTNTNSKWTVNGGLVVGNNSGGNGVLEIDDGGAVTSTDATIGAGDLSSGNVIVTQAGTNWTNTGQLIVGYNGGGTMTVSSGASVSSGSAYISAGGGAGRVLVNNTNSRWTVNGELIIGYNPGSNGVLEIGTGGTVTASGIVHAGYHGIVNLGSGQGAITVASGAALNAGGINLGTLGGTGTLTIASGGNVRLTGDMRLAFNGVNGGFASATVNQQGFLDLNGHDILIGNGTAAFNFTSGAVSDVDVFIGSLNHNGGFLHVGDYRSTPDTMVVTGNYAQVGETWTTFDITGDGPGETDLLVVSGVATLGGRLEVHLLNGFVPEEGDRFKLMDFGALVNQGYFFTMQNAVLPEGLFWDMSSFASTGEIVVIPEPSCLAAVGLGGMLLLRRRSRRTL